MNLGGSVIVYKESEEDYSPNLIQGYRELPNESCSVDRILLLAFQI